MSYQITPTRIIRMIEFTKSSSQSIASGDAITFDTKRTSGGDSVSVNSSTGAITLDSTREYWLTLNIHVERGATTDSFSSSFHNSSSQVTASSGGFKSDYSYHSGVSQANSPTFTAQLVVKNPTQTYYAKMDTVGSSSSINTRTSLFILEVS